MKKITVRFTNIFLIILTSLSLFAVPVKAEEEGINVEAKSAILVEPVTGKVIYEKNSHEKFAPASVTKIMTMLLTMEKVDSGKIKLSDKVTISENAKKMGGSTMLLDTGEIRTVEELLKGVAIASGNDAAVALAEYIGGSEENFAKMMNQRAVELGMKDTTFKNCNGLPIDGHITTAYDIYIMSKELLKHPTILKYTGTYMETISEGRKTPIELVNHNKLVRFFKGCDGLKTGFTQEAKYCISATANRDGVRVLCVIMGAPTYKKRNRDASMLLNYGFSKYESKKIVSKDDEIQKITLNKRGDKFIIAKSCEDVLVTIEKGSSPKITSKLKLDSNKKVIKKGEVIGICEYYDGNNLIGTAKIYSDRDIKKSGFFDNIKSGFRNIFKGSI
ncbi:D-alanyl-D-alanine carboxypeptidase [Clostridium sp. 19966]|uniref:D-alanyl-D-alanine carboxypeptidase family protein n=1 Tax=Clostridium sp. 19966 TaxID=2768166 RepID=UPI0028DEF20F|nr:D-alanyl-D-alanine carboxypeptidase family protein [Clostridium sp. 19966]MDT8716566.1 D-alanyl-D-alanine carboxypeptidase [Clostridium sp. 19966]